MDITIDADLIKLAETIGQSLQKRNYYCASAESCTGGLLAATFTSIAGSSQWFERGYVTYSNQAKITDLGVSTETLSQFGAVSEETAMEMAAGLLVNLPGVDIGLSTTGIAGPGGATPGKPVGMVCFGIAKRTADGINSHAFTHIIPGDRNTVRINAVKILLETAINTF